MLLYLRHGPRRYDLRPVGEVARAGWEFQAAVRGRAGPTRPGAGAAFATRRLWVFPPTAVHGWQTPSGEEAEIVVAHFSEVPAPLRSAAEARGGLSVSLGDEDVRWLRGLEAWLRPHLTAPIDRSALHEDHALLTLSLMALRETAARPLRVSPRGAGERKVAQAETWYGENMREGPHVEDVAEAVQVSPSHLRRLFRALRGEGPHRALQRMQIARAKELLASTAWPVRDVGFACGFRDPAVFCRAFARGVGLTPQAWRADARRHQAVEGPAADWTGS